MIFSVAWRNIWRNKVRSLVVIIAVAIGLYAGVWSAAFMKGMMNQRIDKVIKTELSNIQVHNPEFRKTSEFSNYIPNASDLQNEILKLDNVKGASNRIVIQSMVASAETAAGVLIMGIDPETEPDVTNLNTKIIDGQYFEGISRNPAVIGKKLAEKLNVKVRSKIVITVQDLDNNITSGAFRVAGIYTTNNNIYDESHVFVRYDDIQKLSSFPADAGHEIAVSIHDNELLDGVQQNIKALSGDLEVLSWKELSPEMNYLTESMDLYMYIFIIIILLALLFGIINTMLMVVMERTKEIGMLLAIGMQKLKIFNMIIVESILLSLVGGVIGIIIGAAVARIRTTHPLDLSMWAKGYEALGYDAFVYFHLDPVLLINVAILVILTGVIAALYPAYKALKNDPADALRME
ncbi:MAG: FtsX-like permease family protein [Bacteroidales bacterium]|nr:FtsX-like permease family protein [Bacteroidales bacterium]MCF8402939.1 FtsX-like permease family protein [Bacteroidales bacterium]